MATVRKALTTLGRVLKREEITHAISLQSFLQLIQDQPQHHLRNVFQLFYDMVHYYVPDGVNEYPNDPQTINYIKYDTNALLADDTDRPFLADRLFANRFVSQVHTFKQGAQQNHIYIIQGPPGSGKSTFLKNLMRRLEDYTRLDAGAMYETVWRLNVGKLGGFSKITTPVISEGAENGEGEVTTQTVELSSIFPDEHLFVPCPSHDHPILQIPKAHRTEFLADILEDPRLMERLHSDKEYEWVFKAEPCTICKSIYNALLNRLGSPSEALHMLYAKRYLFNRQLGEGISVYNPGDEMIKKPMSNAILQNLLNNLFRDSNAVRYIYSRLAKTNNGVFTVMDIKGNNKDRILNLHGIISDGVHKVEHVEEMISSLFIAIMNPEDEAVIADIKSYEDRIVRIRMPYVLDFKTEVEIYRHTVGGAINEKFLPRVLECFAKVIISTRLQHESESMKEWIPDPEPYKKLCDKDLMLLKMDIYTGYIPSWVREEDLKNFSARKRRKIISEGEFEGSSGISGRQSIQLFIDFFSRFRHGDQIITMEDLMSFFKGQPKWIQDLLPEGFLDALNDLYAYDVLQEVKEALYDYNQEQVARDIKNYLAAISYDPGTSIQSAYTDDAIEVNNGFFDTIEKRLLGENSPEEERRGFRSRTQKEYISKTLTQEVMAENKPIEETDLYEKLHARYTNRLKQNVLDPLINNESFRMAIKDFNKKEFDTYDQRIKQDVRLLFKNLEEKFFYTEAGAQRVCIYVLDNKLAERFGQAQQKTTEE